MDPITIQSIVTGLITSGLAGMVTYFWRKGRDGLVGKDLIKKMKIKKTALQPIVNKAVEAVSNTVELIGPGKMEKISLFLSSPEVEEIVRQLYAEKISQDRDKSRLEAIQKEFLTSFSLYVGVKEEKLAESAKHFLDALTDGVDEALKHAIDKGILSAHEARSSLRYRIILDELAAIEKNLDFLTSQMKPNIKSILEFEEKYRNQVSCRHSDIMPPHFDRSQRVPIDNLYVCPNFTSTPRDKEEESQTLSFQDFLSSIYRAVILGNPGVGKSTFSLKLCHDLSSNYSNRIFSGRQVTPILVILRNYGAEKKEQKCSLLQFIKSTANSYYQIEPPPLAFEYLLLNGRTIVIFDGLDELLDTGYRREISGDIEAFCNLYPSVPVLVTSREVGYEQAPLDIKRFEVFRLAPFIKEQVKEYVVKWFGQDETITKDSQEKKAEDFMKESEIVSDLRSNPLMLALMCNIYRGENYIPKNRPDVYEKCALMLFERWDKSRGIHVQLPFEAHIQPAMMYLAHWIYSNEKLQGGVIEKKLIEKTTDYLCERRFDDRDEARGAAAQFIEFCKGRAWVFTDVGTTSEGEKLYQFTHRTFLEYFTAAYIVRTNPTPEQLEKVLFPRIARREWDIVCQQSFQILNKNVEGAADDLLTALIENFHKKKGERAVNYLSFAVRALEFIIPGPRVIRDITTECIEFCISWGIERKEKTGKPKIDYSEQESKSPESILAALLSSASENRKVIENTLENVLVEKINNGSEMEAYLAGKIGLNLDIPLLMPSMHLYEDNKEFVDYISKIIVNKCAKRLEFLTSKHFRICSSLYLSDGISIESIINYHGIYSIFKGCSFILFPHFFSYSIFNLYILHIKNVFYHPEDQKFQRYAEIHIKNLKKMSKVFLDYQLPLFKKDKEIDHLEIIHHFERYEHEEIQLSRLHFDNDSVFAFIVLSAIYLEYLEYKGKKRLHELLERIKKREILNIGFIRSVLLARFETIDNKELQKEIKKWGFSKKQEAFTWKWIRKEINLVG
jgi:hypothetical protein